MENAVGHVNRREALRMLTGIPIGIAAGGLLEAATDPIQTTAHDMSGLTVGNASMQASITAACGPQPNQQCVHNFTSSPAERTEVIFWSPLMEELSARAAPSFVRDIVIDPDSDVAAAALRTFRGHEHVPLTRGEFLTGAISSVLFGLTHNIVDAPKWGVNTNTLPVVQTIGGGMLWVLQRKFGYFSNVTAHSFFNFRWLRHPS